MSHAFDPGLVYADCGRCGRRVTAEAAGSPDSAGWAGASLARMNAPCMILSDGCAGCSPRDAAFPARLIRVLPGPAVGAGLAGRPLRHGAGPGTPAP
jgi:hypothetical protein